ncbi:SMI1/KNR4 family protein [Actinophytocola gossypii]|uniref:SMI1/KNR4 family protein n=1 Tax=Actinophytocola gossypii TaxID=2812003 RepID=A0ABT2JGU0_9PSEU|nr:SMI1/KNR4 family protein [Actinophytocola gossypii]MCT2587091.1 SMI1/KNR4 family protein [Actinophytocola gossypii]
MTRPDVDSGWDRIEAWLRINAPTTEEHLGGPARTDEMARITSLVGGPLPDDLVAWWRRSCGTTSPLAARLLNGHTPYSIIEAVDRRSMMLDVAGPDDAALAAEPAGSPCWNWLPMWVPIGGDTGGDLLFVDLRPGQEHGCVMRWYETEFATEDPVWPDVATMLAEIADALEHGTPVHGAHPKVVDDGTLHWA